MNNIWLAFLTGLTTGGLSCLAVQGGLLASAVSHKRVDGNGDVAVGGVTTWHAIGMFLVAKLLAYTLLGFLLGWAGSLLILSPKMLGAVQIAAGLFMLATAGRIANLHPVFRYVVIEPPRWAYRLMRGVSRDSSTLAPALLGFTTVLLPCGVTQATMAIAVASANPFLGAAIMFAFVLGTSPIFFALGAAVLELLKRKLFAYAAAAVVAIFGILAVNGGLASSGSIYTLQNFLRAATTPIEELALVSAANGGGQVAGISTDGFQEITVQVENYGYTPSARVLKAGVPVRMTLATNNARGCTRAFTIPEYGIREVLPETGTKTLAFTPTKAGPLVLSCGMGMFVNRLDVIP